MCAVVRVVVRAEVGRVRIVVVRVEVRAVVVRDSIVVVHIEVRARLRLRLPFSMLGSHLKLRLCVALCFCAELRLFV